MAHVEKSRDRWRAVLRDPLTRRRVTKTLPKDIIGVEEARLAAEALQERLDRGDPALRVGRAGERPLMELAESLVEESALRHTAPWTRFKWRTIKLFLDRVGAWRAGQVNPRQCREFLLARERAGDSASTLRKRQFVLRELFARAVEDRAIVVNPWESIRAPSEPPRGPTFLTQREFSALIEAAPPERRLRYLFLAMTGARLVEAASATWGDVDFRRGVVILRNAQKGGGTRRAYRTVPIGGALLDDLRAERSRPERTIFSSRPTSSRWRVEMGRDCRAAGIERFTLSDLRDTFGSWLAQSGLALQQIRDLMGHGGVTTTERYAHLVEDGIDRSVADRLNGGWR